MILMSRSIYSKPKFGLSGTFKANSCKHPRFHANYSQTVENVSR